MTLRTFFGSMILVTIIAGLSGSAPTAKGDTQFNWQHFSPAFFRFDLPGAPAMQTLPATNIAGPKNVCSVDMKSENMSFAVEWFEMKKGAKFDISGFINWSASNLAGSKVVANDSLFIKDCIAQKVTIANDETTLRSEIVIADQRVFTAFVSLPTKCTPEHDAAATKFLQSFVVKPPEE